MLLSIRQNWVKIGLNSRLAQVKLKIKEPELVVKRSHPKVRINQEMARVECDATQCRAEAGYKTNTIFSRDNRQLAWKTSNEYIANTAADGDMLASVEKYNIGDCMVHYAAQSWNDKEFVFTRIPQSPVDITVIPPSIETNWQFGEVKGDLELGTIKNHSTLPDLRVYQRQKASIDIKYLGSKVDAYR